MEGEKVVVGRVVGRGRGGDGGGSLDASVAGSITCPSAPRQHGPVLMKKDPVDSSGKRALFHTQCAPINSCLIREVIILLQHELAPADSLVQIN